MQDRINMSQSFSQVISRVKAQSTRSDDSESDLNTMESVSSPHAKSTVRGEEIMPEYEHFSFYQNVLFIKAPDETQNSVDALEILNDIVTRMNNP